MDGEFSVYVYHGERYMRIAHLVDAKTAVAEAAAAVALPVDIHFPDTLVHQSPSRVIITDGSDRLAWEWTAEMGVRMDWVAAWVMRAW